MLFHWHCTFFVNPWKKFYLPFLWRVCSLVGVVGSNIVNFVREWGIGVIFQSGMGIKEKKASCGYIVKDSVIT